MSFDVLRQLTAPARTPEFAFSDLIFQSFSRSTTNFAIDALGRHQIKVLGLAL
jgi:hypothetical protein